MAVETAQSLIQESKTSAGNIGKPVNALLHELQLGVKLNTCVVEKRRADFSLMLAMLAEDVREQSQFLLPKQPTLSAVEQSDDSLRKQFNLPDKAPLSLSTLDEISQFNQAQLIVDNDLLSIQLSHVLNPKPLAFRDNPNHICSEVLNNTSFLTQLKYQQVQASNKLGLLVTNQLSTHDLDKPLNQTLAFNANAWLEGIQETLVKASLIN
ncbi:MAG: VC2046/SO_2500 family protein [Colwellia sp.]